MQMYSGTTYANVVFVLQSKHIQPIQKRFSHLVNNSKGCLPFSGQNRINKWMDRQGQIVYQPLKSQSVSGVECSRYGVGDSKDRLLTDEEG